MKRICLLLFLGCLISVGWAEVILQENFGGPVFPPAGWDIEINGSGPLWQADWIRGSLYGYSNYAEGNAITSGMPPFTETSHAIARLYSPFFTLNQADQFRVVVCSYSESLNPPAIPNKMMVLENGSIVAVYNFPFQFCALKPSITEWNIGINQTSYLYRVCWQCEALSTMQGMSNRLGIDNVVLSVTSTRNTFLVPTSLGSIKSAYR